MADTQELVTDLTIRDNLSVGLLKAKAEVQSFGDTASLQAAKANNSFLQIGLSLKNLASGFLAFQVVQQGIGFITDAVKAAQDDEVSVNSLTAALKANVPAWKGQTDAIESAIDAGARLGFTDDEVRESIARLSATTHDLGAAVSIQNVAMDLARFKGISLADATQALVKIEAGRFKGLADLGIVLKAGATQTEALAAVEKVAAGQAEAFGDSGAGAAKRAQIAFDELREHIGTGLMPVFIQATEGLERIVSVDLPSFAKHSADEIGWLSKELQEFGEFTHLKDIGDFFDSFRDKTKDAAAASARAEASDRARGAALLLEARNAQDAATYLKEHTAAVDNSTAAQRQVAEATLAVTQAQQDVTAATKAADEAGGHDALTIAALATANNDLVTAQNQLITARGLAAAAANAASISESQFTRNIEGNTAALGLNVDVGAAAKAVAEAYGKALRDLPTDIAIQVTTNYTSTHSDLSKNVGEKTADDSGAPSFEVSQHNADFLNEQANERERKRLQAIADAKTAAEKYAQVLNDKLNTALSAAKDLATSLFDKQHEKILRAIADTERLAEKQHDASTQAISDALKAQLARDAAPVNAAEKAQSDIELSRQNRDLHAALAAAQTSGDPEQIRQAQESLQSFQAAQNIAYLKEQQAIHDLAAQKEATDKQKAADDLLNAAKVAQAKAITDETSRNKTQLDRFNRELEALKKRDEGASPSKVKSDITALEKRFGIVTDAEGHHHIEDPLVTAIKTIKIPPPNFRPTINVYVAGPTLNGRLVGAAMASSQSPSATPGVRSGNAGRG